LRIFGHHVSRSTIVLAGVEILLVYACMQLALFIVLGKPSAPPFVHAEALFAAVIMITAMTVVGLYEQSRRTLTVSISGIADTLRVAFGVLLGIAVLGILSMQADVLAFEARTLALGGSLALAALILERLLFWRAKSLDLFKRRLLVIGTGLHAATIEDSVGEDVPYKVVAYIHTGESESAAVSTSRVTDLDAGRTLLQIAGETRAEEIVVAIRDRRGNLPLKQLLECKLQGIAITNISTFFEREQQQIQLESLNASWLIFGSGFRQHWFGNTVKRGFDVLASSLLLILASPVMLATVIAIRLEGPGPILYWQTRVGRCNQPFDICKFRSMRPDAESDGLARWAAGKDARITRVGRVIRKLRIDELPQVYNVLKGEMSFVGPRPERPFFVDQLSTEIPFFLARHSIRPGITGWAQVRYPYGASVQDAKNKLQYDLYYVKNHTLFLDLVIMLETVRVVMFGHGAR
jgi:sugar transferase (PEP-CTERM system associated)